ncbi:MAG TPA: hypothetical protein VKG79_04685 [Bryobacteraceae bacterium]|nr:hypothetical protein [Bryobacteraceae bacterium]
MNFVTKLLQAIAFIPSIVGGVENFFGSHSGADKKNSAMSFLQGALSMADAVSSKQIVDEAKFKQGLAEIVDGTVACLNASVWAKTPAAAPASQSQ